MIDKNILSNGVDIVDIARIEKILESKRKDNFLSKVFTEKELSYFEKVGYHPESIAGYFAIKEAVMKSIGEGFNKIPFKDIEINKNEQNNPYLKLYNKAKAIAELKEIDHYEISIAHEKNHAIGFVIACK